MNRPIDKEKMISWLYGELKGEEKVEFENQLDENPHWRAELEEMGKVRELLGGIDDKELPDQPIVLTTERKGFHWRSWYSVAATLLLLFTSLVLFRPQIIKENDRLVIVFGDNQESVNTKQFSKEEVEEMIKVALYEQSEKINSGMAAMNSRMSEWEGLYQTTNAGLSGIELKRIEEFVKKMGEGQRSDVKNLLAKNQEEQEIFVKNLMQEFSIYLEYQRNKDMEYINTYLTSTFNETKLKQEQTDQIIASIISQVNSQNIAD